MSRADVEGVECSTHEAVADSSYVEETVHVDKRAFETIGSDNEDEIPRLHGDTSSGTDLQRADVHVQPGEALAEQGAGVQPPCKKVRRRLYPGMSSGSAASSGVGPNR